MTEMEPTLELRPLTPEEGALLRQLGDAAHRFGTELEPGRESREDFFHHIRAAQNIIVARPVRQALREAGWADL